MGEANFVKILDTVTYLAKDTIDLGAAHFTCHDDREEIVGSEFHNLFTID